MGDYAVIFDSPPRIVGTYDSSQQIRDLVSFPQPSPLIDPSAWELIGESVSKPIEETTDWLTGEIGKRRT
jgi:hypothetical protein